MFQPENEKPNSLLDIDEVLGFFFQALIKKYNHDHQMSYKVADFPKYLLTSAIPGMTINQAVQEIYDFHKSGFYDQIVPTPGAKEALFELYNYINLVAVTARQLMTLRKTYAFLSRHFSENIFDLFYDIYFTNEHAQEGQSYTKRQVAKKLKPKYVFEDSMKNILICLEVAEEMGFQTTAFLMDLDPDASWTKVDNLPENVIHITDWSQVVPHVQWIEQNS